MTTLRPLLIYIPFVVGFPFRRRPSSANHSSSFFILRSALSFVFAKYSSKDLSGKAVCKKELQKLLDLPEAPDKPIIAVISRLVPGKGIDLIKGAIDEMLNEDVQFVVLGTGDAEYEDFFRYISDRYPGKCRTIIAYNKDLSSKIYSGADIFLMPSRFEPCGLSQMIACKYGTIPIVRNTGGLSDSIKAFNNEERNGGNGFKFYNYNVQEMLYVYNDALNTYKDKKTWTMLLKNAMITDFSWHKSATEYEKLYDNMLV